MIGEIRRISSLLLLLLSLGELLKKSSQNATACGGRSLGYVDVISGCVWPSDGRQRRDATGNRNQTVT